VRAVEAVRVFKSHDSGFSAPGNDPLFDVAGLRTEDALPGLAYVAVHGNRDTCAMVT
jgi:hypothetical protein